MAREKKNLHFGDWKKKGFLSRFRFLAKNLWKHSPVSGPFADLFIPLIC